MQQGSFHFLSSYYVLKYIQLADKCLHKKANVFIEKKFHRLRLNSTTLNITIYEYL